MGKKNAGFRPELISQNNITLCSRCLVVNKFKF